ncbi:MAG: helix-turn-helix domain-containing protein [Nanoarchaeota archaeon]|nr:helix-turn-helix domain-containing protein [Nanoarchaeota archaeon]
MIRNQYDLLWRLEGLHTVETVAEELGMSRQSALNLLSQLKKAGHVTVSGSGRRKRLYKVTLTKQWPRVPGMWDVLNRYNPNFQLNPWYDHQVHGVYEVEEVIIDAVQTKSFRIVLATLRLFQHVKDWKKLHRLAKEKGCWQQIGALYDVARLFLKVRKMPERYRKEKFHIWKFLSQLKKKNFPSIAEYWRVYVPFNKNDIRGVVA